MGMKMGATRTLILLALGMIRAATARDFVHPGGLLTQPDIDRIKSSIAAKTEPYSRAWTAFNQRAPSTGRQPRPYAVLTDAGNSASVYAMQNDGHDTYALAVYWALTGNDAYAAAAVRMIMGWAAVLDAKSGTPVATMRTGIGINQMINAAELLRHANGGYAGYTASDIAATERMLRIAVYPILHSAWGNVPAACGPPGACQLPYGDGNWGTAALAGLMAGAVFLGDSAWFQEAVEVYRHGKCPSVNRYILADGVFTGETAESGRDQGHPQFAVGNLLQIAEMAWNQNLDLYGESDNLLLKGVEYLAKYGLGNTVPYTIFGTCHVTYPSISSQNRGVWYPIYELAWNHYHNRRGLAVPYAEQVRSKYAPEASVTDQFGFGTLLYTRSFSPQAPQSIARRYGGIPLSSPEASALSFTDAVGRTVILARSGASYAPDRSAAGPIFPLPATQSKAKPGRGNVGAAPQAAVIDSTRR